MKKDQINLSPKYKELLEKAGEQLKFRRTQILKRTTQKTWPFLVMIIVFYFSFEYLRQNGSLESNAILFAIVISLGLMFSICWYIAFGLLLDLEKHIWIDSYFDNKNLSDKQSWQLAFKLGWRLLGFHFMVFLKYYLLPLIFLTSAIIVGMLWLMNLKNEAFGLVMPYFTPIMLAIIFIPASLFVLYVWYMRIKLRYLWFVFLDNVGPEFSYGKCFDELNKLNKINGSDSFKKALVVTFGTDSVNSVVNSAIYYMSLGLGSSVGGTVGAAVRDISRFYTSELTYQITSFANMAAMYILYRFARDQIYSEHQRVNKDLYKLVVEG